MADDVVLPTLLSQALVAFTIEFDNEFEHEVPHRTTTGPAAKSGRGPWLVSQPMWSNIMQFVAADGVPLSDLESLGRITNLKGLERWGYIEVDPSASGGTATPQSERLVRPSRAGRMAQRAWAPLGAVIEERWRERFGHSDIAELRGALLAVISQLDVDLPDYLPVVAHDMFATVPKFTGEVARALNDRDASQLDLSVLLSKVLLAFTIDFERDSKVSLALSANFLRPLHEEGVRVRDLPRLTGVSKEAVSVGVGVLERRGLAEVDPDPNDARTKLVRLTPAGQKARTSYVGLVEELEQRWHARFGSNNLRTIGDVLVRLVGAGGAMSPLFQGLEPYPDGWRASIRKPATLPHYPMVLHRGGFPDGS